MESASIRRRGGRFGAGAEGPQEGRGQLRLERRHRRRIDGPGLQPRRHARLHRRAASGVQSPAILWLAFVPMLCVATAYLYMNKADPDCGTTFSWVGKAMGPWAGWIAGWAIIVADIIVMANLAQIAGLYSFLLCRLERRPDRRSRSPSIGVVWIAVMTDHLLHRHRALGPHAAVPALGRGTHPRALRGRRARQGLRRRRARHGASKPELSWFSPFAIDSTSAVTERRVARRLHLLGLGQRRRPSTRKPRTRPTRRASRRSSRRSSSSSSTSSSRRPRSPIGGPAQLADAGRGAQPPRRPGLRKPVGQDPDHRGAHVGGRVDADDDPADGAHDALDGARQGDARRVRQRPRPVRDAELLDDRRWACSRSSGTSA